MNNLARPWRFGVCLALAASVSLGSAQVRSELVVGGLTLPVAIVPSPTDSNVLFVVEQRSGTTGRIRVVQNGVLLATPFLSVSPVSTGNEQGLLGLAFAPDYANSGVFYVNYTDANWATNIVRYQRSALNPLQADPATATLIIRIPQPFSNHNGGTIAFGPDQMLYIGLGDGGSANDPGNRAQNTLELLGKMLRIDPRTDGFPGDPNKHYSIPSDNPFVGATGVLPEIYSLGLRNPWKFTLDPATMLGTNAWLIADVGQGAREEIDYEFPSQAGRNYGWRVWEGNLNTGLGGLSTVQPNLTFPIFEYTHSVGDSITGGFVYRGIELGPEFFGRYFYADYIDSRIWSLLLQVDSAAETVSVLGNTEHTAALGASSNISTFGTDLQGELYFAKYGTGQIFRIRPQNRVWMTSMDAFNSTILSGSLRHLVAPDSQFVRVIPYVNGDRTSQFNFRGGLQIGFKTDLLATANLNVTARVWTNQSVGGTVRLFLKNTSTGEFVEVGSKPMTTTPANLEFSGIPAANYRTADGRIEARIRTDVSTDTFASRIVVNVDQILMTSN